MKQISAIVLAVLLPFSLSLRAQTGTLVPVSSDAMPTNGFFWSMSGHFPPCPFDPFPQLPLYTDGTLGNYWFDDRDFDYQAYWSQVSAEANTSRNGGMAMDDAPALPDDGGGTNSSGGGDFSSEASFPTNGLCMQITGITNDIVSLTINNATDMVYEIFSCISLTNSLTNWNIEQAVWPVTNQTSTPFTVQVQDRTNSLFFGARDWTGITSDGNLTIPEWWFWENFGTVDMSETNLDAQGNTLIYDYQCNINPNPNVICFALNVTNQDFNTSSATILMTVSGGVPSYMAVLVDNLDTSSANWTAYNNSNIVVNLGSVEGWHTVSVGLKGYQPDAQQTWHSIQLKLVLTPPVLIITNPIVGLVTQPVIQLQGYCSENLASMSYDLSNASCFEANQQAFVTTRLFDTNNLEYTTNGFQCFNIPLANGTNTLTLHGTDVAGNVTATNLVYVLDPTANTNPPVINLSWPPNNASISGTAFPVLGVVNDPFATVNAQMVNRGGTSNLTGSVEQNGSFWIENVPLGSGTNYLTITATNSAGYGSATNIVVEQSPITLTINSVSFNDPISPSATVNGTLAGSADLVWVNGVEATNNGGGTWTAYYVPVGDSGTATITAEAVASGSSIANFADAAANSMSGAVDAQITKDVVRGPEVALADCNWNENEQSSADSSYGYIFEDIFTDNIIAPMHYSYGQSGYSLWDECFQGVYYNPQNEGGPYSVFTYLLTTWDADGNGTEIGSLDPTGVCGEIATNTSSGYMDPAQYFPGYGENANFQYSALEDNGITSVSEQYLDQQRYVLKTGGQAVPREQNLWVIYATANDILNPGSYNPESIPIPPSQITVAGQTLDTNGDAYLLLPNNAEVDITPMAPGNDYTFSVPSAHTISLQSLTVVSNSATQIDATDWAVVKTNGFVTIQATLSDPTAAPPQLKWSGGGQAVPGNPLQWQVSAATSAETAVTASLGSSNLSLNVWVIWGTVNILTSGANPANAPQFGSIEDGTELLGVQYFNNSNSVAGKICAIATITPTGIHSVITNGWNVF
jgi:hypothetical protein